MLHVVVAEDGVAGAELFEQLVQQRLTAWAGDEVAGDRNEIGLALCDPVDRTLGGYLPA